MVELSWERGHDPELEVYACGGTSPSASLERGQQPLAKVALAPFDTQELHFLLQCHGIAPLPGAKVPTAATAQEACGRLPEVRGWPLQSILLSVALTVLLVLLWRHRGLRLQKAKMDDESLEMGDAI
ncbi:unnamed protein product [Effrenium voratum]|nr:unnamed protein product [Effrenium voratum]